MGEVLKRDEQPRYIWDQHAEIMDAMVSGDGEKAESLVRTHITQAAGLMLGRLRGQQAAGS